MSAPQPRPDFFLFGIPYWNPSYEEFKEWWDGVVESETRGGKILCLANPHTMNLAASDPKVMAAWKKLDVFVNDGVGIRLAGKMRGEPARYNFAGTDLMPRLFSEARRPLTAFFYGASEESNRVAVEKITAANPMLRVVGRINGFVDPETEALPLIAASGADILMCALGQPKQEFFMLAHRERLNVKVCVTCGGMFDFFSQIKPRAPLWMRRTGTEWLFRLLIEPKRMFRRYVYGNRVFMARSLATLAEDRRLMLAARKS